MLAGKGEISSYTGPPGTEVTGWVSFIIRNFFFLFIYTSSGEGGLGVYFSCDGIVSEVAVQR